MPYPKSAEKEVLLVLLHYLVDLGRKLALRLPVDGHAYQELTIGCNFSSVYFSFHLSHAICMVARSNSARRSRKRIRLCRRARATVNHLWNMRRVFSEKNIIINK